MPIECGKSSPLVDSKPLWLRDGLNLALELLCSVRPAFLFPESDSTGEPPHSPGTSPVTSLTTHTHTHTHTHTFLSALGLRHAALKRFRGENKFLRPKLSQTGLRQRYISISMATSSPCFPNGVFHTRRDVLMYHYYPFCK